MVPNAAKRAKIGSKAKPIVREQVHSKQKIASNRKNRREVDENISASDGSSEDENVSSDEEVEEYLSDGSDLAADESSNDDEEDSENDEFSEPSDDDDETLDKNDEDNKTKKHIGDGFDDAMNAILGSKIKAHDASNPILIRNKRTAKEIDEAREERKVRRASRAEKLQHKDKARVKEVVPKDPELAGDVISHEKKLRKTAQRGVVKSSNAINSAQSAALANAGFGTQGATDKRKAEATTEMSKEKFLDMIRLG